MWVNEGLAVGHGLDVAGDAMSDVERPHVLDALKALCVYSEKQGSGGASVLICFCASNV